MATFMTHRQHNLFDRFTRELSRVTPLPIRWRTGIGREIIHTDTEGYPGARRYTRKALPRYLNPGVAFLTVVTITVVILDMLCIVVSLNFF